MYSKQGKMSNLEKLDDCKKEIRSVLIAYQKGCYLNEFNRAYRELIGKRLPVREFGFNTDTEFLHSIPDVVRLTPVANGNFHLLGIADEKSMHIQKMVSRQKPARLKAPPPRRVPPSYKYHVPPRFNERRSTEPKLSTSTKPKEPLLLLPKTAQKEPSVKLHKTIQKEQPPKSLQNESSQSSSTSAKEEVISLVQNSKDGLALDDLLVEYKRMYKKSLSLSQYGFSSIEDCIHWIPELDIVQKNNVSFIVYRSKSRNNSDIEDEYSQELTSESLNYGDNSLARIPTPEGPLALQTDPVKNQNCDSDNLPKSVRENFQEIAKRFQDGIWASDFPSYYEEVTCKPLDIHGLGYRTLGDLIDEAPDIFIRRPVAGSRKDYIIYPANEFKSGDNNTCENPNVSLPLVGSALVDHIVLNLRTILEAYPEGVKIGEILHIYSINCKDALHIEDLGFDDIDTFLSSLKNRVPLKFDVINGVKSVHLLKLSDCPVDLYNTTLDAYENEAIPFDAVFPEFVFKPQTLPADFDFSKFFPVYTSAVATPSKLYIQLQGDDVSDETFKTLGQELDHFYDGSHSDSYMMKNIHIKEGASCIAKWPADNHWYRAQILAIPSMETVKVYYVDYGTKDIIPKFLLRYAKKEYIDFPAQAIRCRLAYLKPPNNTGKWDIESRNLILRMCIDIALMAKIEEIGPDSIYSILLCDTNGEEDIFINDVLCNEKLAEYETADSGKKSSVPPAPKVQLEYHHNLIPPLQALQAQYFLKAFAAVAPSFAQNEHYLVLLGQISMYCQNADPVQQNVGMPFMPAISMPAGPPGFNTLPSNMSAAANSNLLYNAYPNATPALVGNPFKMTKANALCSTVSTADLFVTAPNSRESFTLPKTIENSAKGNGEGENELFDDDDDEMFQQFCQKVSSTNVRYVKRVMLDDGYKMHIIVVESKPYASSGDISQLIWNNKEADYLLRRLQLKEEDIPTVSLSEDGNEELFQQLERFNVKGVQKTTGFKSSVLLYPLRTIIKILNIFGHPSVTLRTKLTEEIANFNPNNQEWQEFSLDTTVIEDEDNFSGVTDDDKIERLCLFDLLAMKESINCKRKKMMSTSSASTDTDSISQSDEIRKLEQLYLKVLSRIQEIREICNVFA